MTEPIADKFLLEAIDRIARTPDGRLQYLLLQRKLMSVLPTADPCALSTHHGERLFASALIGLMAKGIIESGGRTSSDSTGADEPIVRPTAQPVATGRSGGAGRRITEHTHVPGYDYPADEA